MLSSPAERSVCPDTHSLACIRRVTYVAADLVVVGDHSAAIPLSPPFSVHVCRHQEAIQIFVLSEFPDPSDIERKTILPLDNHTL
jgi:hypothetical protein